ncbi:type 4a pilus biogenesis protein PilO [Phycisphaerales bacterium AB-hyl4]|uniref:Type 4a pilus biogenesis protein PilO n=1 Tax=Natronomicrosphaera hydrolytica TaxID=3242702 RepID=A0ABV4UAT8_9BACT
MPVDKRDLKLLGLSAGVMLLLVAVLWLPGAMERRELSQRIDDAKQRLAGELADVQLLHPLGEQVVQLHAAIDEAPHHVPAHDELDHLLRRLTEALDAFDLQQQEIVTERTRRYDDHGVSTVSMRFEGGFPATYGVLQQIESMPRLVRLDRVSFEPASSDIGGALRVQVQLSSFFTD